MSICVPGDENPESGMIGSSIAVWVAGVPVVSTSLHICFGIVYMVVEGDKGLHLAERVLAEFCVSA